MTNVTVAPVVPKVTKTPRAITEVINAPIRNLQDAVAFINVLHSENYVFHLEDAPHSIVSYETGEALFTAAEAALVDQRVTECYEQDWCALGGEIECPIGYILSL